MKPAKIDVPVLITFFVRPETLEKVFDSVRTARPTVLLLWQDGPRCNRPDDIVNINKCRDIVEHIDWECKVYKNYLKENLGCDPSTFLAQKWAFSLVDKCIILEDDRVPCQSFYNFCKELLDRYEFDERINHICGTNLLENNKDCDADYFFAPAGSTTWASWRRVANTWDENYSYLDNAYAMKCLKSIKQKNEFEVIFNHAIAHKKEGKQYWETILGMGSVLQNRLAIIPKKNMVEDLGLTVNSTHAVANKHLLPKYAQKMFYMKSYDITFPIKHPEYVIADMDYYSQILRNSGIGRPFIRFMRKVEYGLRCMWYGEFTRILKFKNKQ